MKTPPPILPLTLDGVSYEAGGLRLLDDVTFRLTAGARTIVLGANGAGKSLLLRMCHGLLQPTRGRVAWSGRRPARHQAMVFQRPVLLRRSVLANVIYPLRLRGLDRRTRRLRAAAALAQAGLEPLAHRPARVLSSGEQQRLALARAWALSPQVLFLDEPTANLDPTATRSVETMIDAFHALGAKIVMTTHDLGQARRLADEVLFLHDGRLLERGDAAAFLAGPQTAAAQAFVRGELPW